MRPVHASKLALLAAATVVGATLAGGGCMDLLKLQEYTLCGPRGAGGCGGAGGAGGGEDAGPTDAHADH